MKTLDAAIEQHRLITSERILLSKTLKGAVDMLGDVLALVSPAAFGRATRIREYVATLASHLKAENRWAIEVAAMLSQVAVVTLPPATLERYQQGERLTPEELAMVSRLPQITDKLLSNIPRLDTVREILDATSRPVGAQAPLGARIVKIALDYDALESRGMDPELALETMRGRKDVYDPVVFETFAEMNGGVVRRAEIRELLVAQLQVGMVLAEPITSRAGSLICGRGQTLGETLIERIKNFALGAGVREPIRVIVKKYPDGDRKAVA
jgi:response regulator RpfG family c-di-GMP phosphodiesterase